MKETFPIIAGVVLAGIAMRLQWQGEYNAIKPERLEGDWGFTGVKFITQFVLTWPGIMPLLR